MKQEETIKKTPFWENNKFHPILGYRHSPDPPVKSDFHRQKDSEVAERKHQRLIAKIAKDEVKNSSSI